MNHDYIIMAALALGGVVGFLWGYSQGHEHGKIAGRIAYRKAQRVLENERMVSEARESAWIKAWDSK